MKIRYREGTTDEKVIEEVIKRNVYEKKKINFLIETDDVWLDLGANIGTFSLLCLKNQCKVYGFEPEPENFKLYKENIELNKGKKIIKAVKKAVHLKNGKTLLYLCKGDYNKYRHTLIKKKGRNSIPIHVISIYDLINKYDPNAIKMDIEGTEIELLENIDLNYLKKIKKLVFEYSFDVDKSIPRFLNIIKRLHSIYSIIHYDKVKPNELEYNYFPAATMVFCLNNE